MPRVYPKRGAKGFQLGAVRTVLDKKFVRADGRGKTVPNTSSNLETTIVKSLLSLQGNACLFLNILDFDRTTFRRWIGQNYTLSWLFLYSRFFYKNTNKYIDKVMNFQCFCFEFGKATGGASHKLWFINSRRWHEAEFWDTFFGLNLIYNSILFFQVDLDRFKLMHFINIMD